MPRRPDPRQTAGSDGASPRERIVAAAERCFDRFGVDKTTVEDIAADAGLSRATFYRYFAGGRDEVILAVLFGDFQRLFPRLLGHMQQAKSLPEGLVETFVEALTFIREESRPELMLMVERMLAPGSPGATDLERIPRMVFDLLVEAARPYFDQARADGLLREQVTVEDAVEFVTRMLFSLLGIPGHTDRTPQELRRFLRTYVTSALFVDTGHQTHPVRAVETDRFASQ